ncbi:toll-like receptor Tollo isoform X2 [Plodia interpunctella]|uniref:toll-like receptor Tollo isoform X2 n=1 Tax=Plodia interpunctella TaxID=58824 RepID=UPI0023682860|nr:toll-like receptor Tollo isoform X2 [Plodia interpunctella]
MYFKRIRGVLVILSVLISASYGQAVEVKGGPACDITQREDTLTVNCSRRDIDSIPTWPEQINNIEQVHDVVITFFNNSISFVTELGSVPGSHVAISFKSNAIDNIDEDAFSNVPRMLYLDLSNNLITGEVLRSEIFHGPYKNDVYDSIALETLNLGFNQIHSLDRYLFQYTPNLTRLYLNNNPIELLDHVTVLALSSAVNLEVLDLSKTDIDTIPLDAFRGLLNLQHIDLSDNRFTTVPESLSLVGSTLKYLTFNKNPIVKLDDDSFIGLNNLIELEVAENDYLEEVTRSTFSPLRNLRILHLCHNENLRYISHNAFRGLKDKWTLKEIYLDDNNLSELSPDLMPWNKLEILGMTGNNWLCNCDLANIITTQGAGSKFKPSEIPYCAAPMKLAGSLITNITVSFCPAFDKTFTSNRGFSLGNLSPRHVIWSILGVAFIALIGMMLGMLVKGIKTVYVKRIKNQSIRYVNLKEDAINA